jgi:GNAT superfamily N-acetyltransferase
MKVRAMKESDAQAVAELARELGYPSEDEEMRRRIAVLDKSNLVLVAVDPSGAAMGYVQAHRRSTLETGFRVEIAGLVVSSGARRSGVGRRLIAEAEQWASKIGAEVVLVRSNTARKESHFFYPALGYALTKTQAVYEKRLPS